MTEPERPAVRLVVDAMNVIGSRPDKWWNNPDRAVRDFVGTLDRYAGLSGEDIVVVLDKDPGALPGTTHVEVVVASWKGRNAADNEIVRLVSGSPTPAALKIVTSDKRLRERVSELGARVSSAGGFRTRMERALSEESSDP